MAQPENAAVTASALRSPTRLKPAALAVVLCVLAAVELAFAAYGFSAKALLAAFAGGVLVVIAAFDIKRRIVPNRIVLPATALVLAGQLALDPAHILRYALGALLAASITLLPSLFARNAIGMGDVKLALLVGASVGGGFLAAILLGFLCTFPVTLAVVLRGGWAKARSTAIPMAPFFAAGTLFVLLSPGLAGH